MLPDANDLPASSAKGGVVSTVSRDVARDLRVPVVAVRRRLGAVLGAGMPEAPINEHSDPTSPKDDVRTAPTVGLGSDIDAKAQTTAVESGTERSLRSRVDTSVSHHDCADCPG